MSARSTPSARMGATTSMNIVSLELSDEDDAVRMPRFPRPSPCPFARDPAGSLSCHTSNSSPVHFRTRPLRCLTLPASQTSQHLNPQPFIIMSRADGRAFVIDAAGSTEITAASSNFLRALASAGTAPPRSAENTSINDPTPTQALTLPVPTEVDAALENSNALVPAAPVATSPAPAPSRPRTRSTTRREYFPRANQLYEALTGARRRREPSASPTNANAASTNGASQPSHRGLSVDGRHVADDDTTGLRRRRRRLAGRFFEGEDAEQEYHTVPESTPPGAARDPTRSPRTSSFSIRRPDGGLDIARVARELGESLRATRDATEDQEMRDDHEDVTRQFGTSSESEANRFGESRALRARVAFLADALLTILREVDSRLVHDDDDDQMGRLTGLLGFGPTRAEEGDLASLPPTTIYGGVDGVDGTTDTQPDTVTPDASTRTYAEAVVPKETVIPPLVPVPPELKKEATPSMLFGACSGCDDDSSPQCYICLEEFSKGEEIRELPCHHAFHQKCVDKWLLRSSRKCPTCRAEVPRIGRRGPFGAPFDAPETPPEDDTRPPQNSPPMLALPRPNMFFLPAPEAFASVAPERVPSPAIH